MTGSDQLFGEHRDPEEIREEIRETTAELTETIEALQTKLAPETLVAEAKDEVRQRARSMAANLQQHPVAATAVGVGAFLILGRALLTKSGRARLVSLCFGAALGAATYRLLAGDVYRDENDADLTITQDFAEVVAPPGRAALE